jgi:hypothetical protein
MSGNGGYLAVGLADGVLKGLQIRRQWEKDDEDRAAREEDRAYTRKQRQQADALHIALQNAATPGTVSESGALPNGLQFASNEDADAAAAGQPNAPMPEVPRFRLQSGEGVQRFDTKEQADNAAAQFNDPAAMGQRVTQAMLANGKPVEAMAFQQQAEKYANEHFRKKLGDAIQSGFGGLESLINTSESGQFKGRKVKIVPSQDGKTVTLHTVGEDGTTTPTQLTFPNDQKGVVQAAYMLDQTVTPESRYKLLSENDRKEEEHQAQAAGCSNEVKIPLAEARSAAAKAGSEAALARAEATLARAQNVNSGRTTADERAAREERLKWTSLHDDAGRRLTDSQKTLRSLQGNLLFMNAAKKPGTPEAAQLQNLQDDIATYKSDREMYGRLLGGAALEKEKAREQDGASPAAAPAAPGGARPVKASASKGKVPAPTTKAEYDAIPKGAKYQHPEDPPGTYRTKK